MDNHILVAWMEAGMIQIPNLLMGKYKQLGIDEKELVVLLHIFSFKEEGKDFPTPDQICERMNLTNSECSGILRRLVQSRLLGIEEGVSERGIHFEQYSLKPLWLRLAEEMEMEKKQEGMEKALRSEEDLYTMFEQEFGRPLSPMECENLAMWVDQDGQDAVIIKAALREAVLAGKLSFRYIDRILFNWKKNGVRTIEQARAEGQQFRQKGKQLFSAEPEIPSKSIPVYNWLEQ